MTDSPLCNRTIAPQLYIPTSFEYVLPDIEKSQLDNKTPVYYLQDTQIKVIQLDFFLEAGSVLESKLLVASLCNQLLKSGTKTKTAVEIDELLEHYGVYLKTHCETEYASISVKVLAKHLTKILPVLEEIFTECIFPQHEIDLVINKSKQSLLLNLQKADYVANRKIHECLFGATHPYGKNIIANDYDAIRREDLQDFYVQFYTKGFCKIFIAGCLPENFLELLNTHFGRLPFEEKQTFLSYPIVPKSKQQEIEIQHSERGVQSSIRMGAVLLQRQHPDFLKARMTNIVLGGYFGSRLMKEVREKKGYTYGIHSYIQNNKQECAWIIASETGFDVRNKAVKAIYKEMKKMQETRISEEELALVKNFYLGLILGDIEGTLNIMNIWKSLILNKTDATFFYDNIHTIKSINTTQIQELAVKYLDPKNFITLLVN